MTTHLPAPTQKIIPQYLKNQILAPNPEKYTKTLNMIYKTDIMILAPKKSLISIYATSHHEFTIIPKRTTLVTTPAPALSAVVILLVVEVSVSLEIPFEDPPEEAV